MEKINSIKSINILTDRYAVKGTLTNNYLLSNEYESLISKDVLFCIENDSNAFLLSDKGRYFQLFYFINNINEFFYVKLDKPIVMEILYRGESKKPLDIISFWEKCGFNQHIVRENMIGSYKQLILPEEKMSDIQIKYADNSFEATFAKEIIESTFDQYTGDILNETEIHNFYKNKNILCAYWKGNLSGILQFEVRNNVFWIGHIAVAPEFRGKGIANELVKAYISDNVVNSDTRYQLWVMKENMGAVDLYKKFGFIYGNKSSASMLKL